MKHQPIDVDALDRLELLTEALSQRSGDDHATAIVFLQTGSEPVTVSRSEFIASVRRHAHALHVQGIGYGDLVLVAHDDVLSLVYTFWGLVLLGAVPSIYTTPNERLFPEVYMSNVAGLIRDVEAKVLLTLDELADVLAAVPGCRVLPFGRVHAALRDHPGDDLPVTRVGPGDLAYLQTSSGTTGNQRCIPTTHRMLLKQLASYARRMELTSGDVILNWMPLHHDGGLLLGAILPFVCAVPVVLMSPLDWVRHPAMLFKAIDTYRGTLCTMPNFAFSHLVRRVRERDVEGISLSSMRAFMNGSERVYHTSFDRFLERFAPLGVTRERFAVAYGLAENTLMATHTIPGKPVAYDTIDRDRLELEQIAMPATADAQDPVVHVSCGPPLQGVEVKIVGDDNLMSLPLRHVGQVAIRSESLFSGYYRHPELNESLFKAGWLLTGDMGYLADGELYIVGRLKDLIINGGKNIYPADIEEIVSTVPGVRPGRVVAFGIPDDTEGTELIAVVVEVDTDETEKKAEIERQIRRAVTQETALTVTFLDVLSERWIIKTSSGKTSRTANRRKWLQARQP